MESIIRSLLIAMCVHLYAMSAYPIACLVASLVVIGLALLDLGVRLVTTTSLHKHKNTTTHVTTPVSETYQETSWLLG